MNADYWVAIVAGAALLLDLIVHLVGGTWLLSRSRESLLTQLTDKISDNRKEVDQELRSFRDEIGETFAAMRQGLTDVNRDISRVELEAYKSFVRRDSFIDIMNRHQDVVSARLDKVDAKIDQHGKDADNRLKEVERKLDQAINSRS